MRVARTKSSLSGISSSMSGHAYGSSLSLYIIISSPYSDMYGISEDDRGKAERCIESTIEYIKNYCHIDSIPDDLKHTVILMAADLFRYDVSASSGQYDNVTSIKEGDVTVSYGSNSSSMSSVFKDYKARLARFRKLVW